MPMFGIGRAIHTFDGLDSDGPDFDGPDSDMEPFRLHVLYFLFLTMHNFKQLETSVQDGTQLQCKTSRLAELRLVQ